MKRNIILSLLLGMILSFQAFAAESVTINNVKYNLYLPTQTVNSESGIYQAEIIGVANNASEITIPYSVFYNGNEYYVRHITIPSGFTSSNNLKVIIADNVDLYSDGSSSSNGFRIYLKTLIIGKNVKIRGTNVLALIDNRTPNPVEVYCYDEKPISFIIGLRGGNACPIIDINYSEIRPNLYVPLGAEKDYSHAVGWNQFNIIGLEELGDVTESNVTSASFNFNQKSAIIDTHTVTALPISIDNKNEISAIEFDVVLPANVEMQGENPITGSERGAEMSFSTTVNEDGSLHIVATTTNGLPAGKGNIATIAVQTAKSDNYAITLHNVKVTTKTGKVISLDNEVLQFVANHKKGDYNEDGDVDIVDAQNLLDYVLGI